MAASRTSFSGSEAYYKSNLDLVLKENKQLKLKVDQLERENRDLRKSVYDLSIRLCACLEHVGKSVKPFNIDSIATMTDSTIRGEIDPSILSELMIKRVDHQGRDKAKAHHQTDGRHMYLKFDLKGHAGPVYSGQFSKATNLLASGSFDQTVRVWNMQTQREELCFAEHQLIVSDVCWSDDGAVLLSGGYDHCVKEWDVAAGKAIHSYGVGQGFVLAIQFNPADNGVFLAVGTSKLINVFDRRDSSSSGASSLVMENDCKVNALHIYRNGLMCLTGDSRGAIKLWDFRKGACCLETLYNEDGHKPISWMEASHPVLEDGEEEGRYLAVNSFDNVLRVYDQSSVLGQGKPLLQQGMKMLHAVKGTRNKNWTIKSSLFRGQDYKVGRKRNLMPTSKHDSSSPWRGDGRSRMSAEDFPQDVSIHESLLVATGSADNYAYIYDISGPQGTAELVQRLEGHNDRVCAAVYHPRDPILASCSADFTIKIWASRTHVFSPLG